MGRSASKNKAIDTIYLNFNKEFNNTSLSQHLCIQVVMLGEKLTALSSSMGSDSWLYSTWKGLMSRIPQGFILALFFV